MSHRSLDKTVQQGPGDGVGTRVPGRAGNFEMVDREQDDEFRD